MTDIQDLLNSETTLRTNKVLKIISKITESVMSLPQESDYEYQLTMNEKVKKRVKRCNKKLAKMLKGLMVKTTREKDNHEVFEALTSQVLLSKYHYVVDTADDLMESANKNIDRHIKEQVKGEDYERELEKAFSLKHDHAPSISHSSSELIKRTKHYLLKPQLNFVPKMENTYFQFVPTITYKPNAL